MSWPNRTVGSLSVSPIAMGGAHWSLWPDHDDDLSTAAFNAGIDAGINFVDTAFRYTCEHEDQHNEKLIRKALDAREWKRNIGPTDIKIATKGDHFGNGPEGFIDGRPETIRQHAEASLRELRAESLDLYYLHWPDPEVPIEESVGAIEQLRIEGKVRNIGVSNFTREQLDKAMSVAPIAALQNKFNPGHMPKDELDLIEFTNAAGIAYVPYSPLGGTFPPTPLNPTRPELITLAQAAGVSVPVLVLNWHLNLSPNIIPLVGSRRPESLIDSARVLTTEIPDEISTQVKKVLVNHE
jgi:aryl-alcohol dehydrogenase-like predicted oxidoreductase